MLKMDSKVGAPRTVNPGGVRDLVEAMLEEAPRIPRGLNFAVLRAVKVLGIRASGTEIRQHLEKATDREISAAKVYVALSRLEEQGLVTCQPEVTNSAGRRGRPRNVYQLSAPGLRALEAGMKVYGSPVPRKGGTENENTEIGQEAPAKVG